ncbi:MAG TPA: bifunctional methylenetetrahydrofolate dehydrogenase/methenyltetrahydrofolate cyclohydrolase FolD [Rickettsiales bacterium]|nr:bifunctional methylenetetrahydrofolate dehydrogenase/methenyltetrahydrofolate cyclohydrolase FolD [Rickettsiales bacterium]
MEEGSIIDGKAYAAQLRGNIKDAVAEMKAKHGITPGLAVVLVGNDPASEIYVGSKGKMCREVGIEPFDFRLPETTTQAELIAKVEELGRDPKVNGILVQLPLPKHISESSVINAINPEKDVDGFHVINAGKLATGQDGMVPCTPLGCVLLLKRVFSDLSGKHAIVIGRSNIVGKPVAQLLLKENCTVTIAHSKTKNLPELCKQAHIIVAATGRPEMVKGEWMRNGAVVIDVGINRITLSDGSNKLVGDVAFAEAVQRVKAITPVPGGVGPMTIACLLANTLKATCIQNNLDSELFGIPVNLSNVESVNL